MNKLKVLFISDIHFFHNKTPTIKIIEELKAVFNYSLKDIDIVFIGGDVFDRLSTVPKDQVVEVMEFIFYFLNWSKTTDTQIRILEGTPSHDWQQAKLFVSLNTQEADVKYFPELCIEYNERYGIHVLYIPDEWRASCDDTLKEVKALLKSKALEQVDLAIMHGNFHYQLPQAAKAPKHDEAIYLKLVKHYISIGHNHNYSTYERIIAQGSFSRLKHNEEGPKGYVIADIDLDNRDNDKFVFIENKSATIYKTIDIANLPLKKAFSTIKRVLKTIPVKSHIRLRANVDNALLKDIQSLYREYPLYYWTLDAVSDKKDKEITPLKDYECLNLNPSNLIAELVKRLKEKDYPEETLKQIEQIIHEEHIDTVK